MQLICVLGVTFFSLIIDKYLNKKHIDKINPFIKYGTYSILIYLSNLFIIFIYCKASDIIYISQLDSVRFSFKYAIMSLAFCFAYPIIISITLNKNIIIKTISGNSILENNKQSKKKTLDLLIFYFLLFSVLLFRWLESIVGCINISNIAQLLPIKVNFYVFTSCLYRVLLPTLLIIITLSLLNDIDNKFKFEININILKIVTSFKLSIFKVSKICLFTILSAFYVPNIISFLISYRLSIKYILLLIFFEFIWIVWFYTFKPKISIHKLDSKDDNKISLVANIFISIIYFSDIFLILFITWSINIFTIEGNKLLIPFNVLSNYLNIIFYCAVPTILIIVALIIAKDLISRFKLEFAYKVLKNKSINITISPIIKKVYAVFSISLMLILITYLYKYKNILEISTNNVKGLLYIEIDQVFLFPEFKWFEIIIKSFIITLIILSIDYILKPKVSTYSLNEKVKSSLITKIIYILKYIMLIIAFIIFYGTDWVMDTFGNVTAEMFMFQIRSPMKGVNNDYIISFILKCLVPSIIIALLIFALLTYIKIKNLNYKISIKKLVINIRLRSNIIIKIVSLAMSLMLLISSIVLLDKKLNLVTYINSVMAKSSFIDDNYVNTKEVNITFPKKKRNLIYIFMESMETTYLSNELGGATSYNYISEIAELGLNNINFSNTEKLGGAIQVSGTGWTIAAMVSQHTGIPFKLPIEGNSYNEYSSFLTNAYTLGDILKKEGYNQTLIVGSDADFGGRKNLFTQHGEYKILDLFTAREDGIIPKGYQVFWGYEDEKLYEYAKKELRLLSKKDEPFNLTMLTVDTHHPDGYKCRLCENTFSNQMFDVFSCASRQLDSFISWIKEQDFYENTTIVISGDHLSMSNTVAQMIDKEYERTTINVFINSVLDSSNKTNRLFSTMDMFPTTLASMGVTIDGDRLALGTNLFSDRPTLLEIYGREVVEEGLNSHSLLYDSLY